MKSPKNILLISGCPGIGKTYICAALTEWMLETFPTYRYHREEDLLKRLRTLIQQEEGDYSREIELLCDDDFVILDDVGSGLDYNKKEHKNLEWRAEVFFTFLDYRYRTMKPTVITSNFTRKVFMQMYSPRIESRLFASENMIIEMEEQVDKRKKGM